jgi:hypothetical protein
MRASIESSEPSEAAITKRNRYADKIKQLQVFEEKTYYKLSPSKEAKEQLNEDKA